MRIRLIRGFGGGSELLTFKVDVSVWDELIALITMRRGASGSLYTQKCDVIFIVNRSCTQSEREIRSRGKNVKSANIS